MNAYLTQCYYSSLYYEVRPYYLAKFIKLARQMQVTNEKICYVAMLALDKKTCVIT